MSAKTVSDILTEIVAETVSDLSNADMLKYFISAARQVPTLIRERAFLATDTLVITSGSNTGDLTDLSPAFVRERFVWWLDVDGHRQPIVKGPSLRYFHGIFSPGEKGNPDYYHIFAQTIEIDRLANGNLTVGFDYFAEVTAGMTTSTSMSIDEQMVEAMKFMTKAEYYEQYEEDGRKSDKAERKGLRLITRLEEEYQDHEFGGLVEETETY